MQKIDRRHLLKTSVGARFKLKSLINLKCGDTTVFTSSGRIDKTAIGVYSDRCRVFHPLVPFLHGTYCVYLPDCSICTVVDAGSESGV